MRGAALIAESTKKPFWGFHCYMAETMRFELMVGISHTTLPTSHLKPLGQVSMRIYSTDFPFFCQL